MCRLGLGLCFFFGLAIGGLGFSPTKIVVDFRFLTEAFLGVALVLTLVILIPGSRGRGFRFSSFVLLFPIISSPLPLEPIPPLDYLLDRFRWYWWILLIVFRVFDLFLLMYLRWLFVIF